VLYCSRLTENFPIHHICSTGLRSGRLAGQRRWAPETVMQTALCASSFPLLDEVMLHHPRKPIPHN
jgi:hypothetical protein